MKKFYEKPVLGIDSFATEEIMDEINPYNVLSRNTILGEGGYYEGGNTINFHSTDNNFLNSVNYSTFTN